MMVELSLLFPVASVLSLEVNGTSVALPVRVITF